MEKANKKPSPRPDLNLKYKTNEEFREKAKEKIRTRYHTDPEYREKMIRNAKLRYYRSRGIKEIDENGNIRIIEF